MGYVKLFKADRTFDLLPADNIMDVQESGGTSIVFNYSNGTILQVNFSSINTEDTKKILDAVLKIEGASGEGIAPSELSAPITSMSASRII
jgi:uncharacterized protein YdhG (YjbR/CyaY superfamily)